MAENSVKWIPKQGRFKQKWRDKIEDAMFARNLKEKVK